MRSRREFITFLGGAAAAWPLAVSAQQAGMPVVGWLDGAPLERRRDEISSLRRSLNEAGFVEGKNVAIEFRSAGGEYGRLPALAAELVQRQVSVIAASTPVAALAAKAATPSIPIVFSIGSDPVKDGLVASLNRPGGNITGVTFLSNLLSSKRLALLQELVPANVIALLLNPNNANSELERNETEIAARALGVQVIVLRASTEREIEAAFADLVQRRAAALLVSGDSYIGSRSKQIVELAASHAIPTCAGNRDHAVDGILICYGADRFDSSRQFGTYVGRILKGEKPIDLPVMQPTKFQLVINLKTAKTLRLDIPPMLLARADEVIE